MKKTILAAILFLLFVFSACSAENTNAPASTTVSDTCDSHTVTTSDVEPVCRYIELSGKKNDSFVAPYDCYTEGDKVVLYFQKGITVKGDMLKTTEKIMDDLCSVTGLSFDKNHSPENIDVIQNMYFEKNVFEGINPGSEKISVLIINDPEEDYIQWAFADGAVLFVSDYDHESGYYTPIYHELSHVIHTRNGAGLSSMMNEGFASYTEYMAMRKLGYPSWNIIQYYSGTLFDDSLVTVGEKGFSACYDNTDHNYQYGFRFFSFLYDVYGDDIFIRILNEATAQKYDESFDSNFMEQSITEDTEHIKEIIKSQTSDDVFDRFLNWYKKNWELEYKDFKDYMKSIGVEVG